MSEYCRQHYELATGKGLAKSPGGSHPGYQKGGKVKAAPGQMAARKPPMRPAGKARGR